MQGYRGDYRAIEPIGKKRHVFDESEFRSERGDLPLSYVDCYCYGVGCCSACRRYCDRVDSDRGLLQRLDS
jgi:hypothetical protein